MCANVTVKFGNLRTCRNSPKLINFIELLKYQAGRHHLVCHPPVGLIVNATHSAQLINAVVEWKVNPKISYKSLITVVDRQY